MRWRVEVKQRQDNLIDLGGVVVHSHLSAHLTPAVSGGEPVP
jgi:hypothetical protein